MHLDYSSEVIRYRHVLGFQKSKRYSDWLKRQNPRFDRHHILGSYIGRKMTDYLQVLINHKFHIETVTGNEGKYFRVYLLTALTNLKKYAKETHNIDIDINNQEPEAINQIIVIVHEMDKRLDFIDEKEKVAI